MVRIIIFVYRRYRIYKFMLLSGNTIDGNLTREQPVQVVGRGRVSVSGLATIGCFPSPHFFSGYSYLEARGASSSIRIGDGTKINNCFVAIADRTQIEIGSNCLIGTCVEIYDSDFHSLDASVRNSGDHHACQPVRIGNNVFVGSNVRILKGASIGDGSTIGNGSVVSGDIPPRCIASGVPARVIRRQ